jgi:hypothetical protein
VADDYLRAAALTLLMWAWQQIAQVSSTQTTTRHTSRWQQPAAALKHWIQPEFAMRVQIIRARLA